MEKVKLIAGKYYVPAFIDKTDEEYRIKFKFNRTLISEIKSMDGARWNPDFKIWSFKNNQRNRVALDFLMGEEPFERYDKDLISFETVRPLYKHQKEMVSHCLTRHYCIIACEMGTGKTLAAIEAMEKSKVESVWWIGPKSALKAVELEFEKWGTSIYPELMTYAGLKSRIEDWDGGKAPQMVVFDESSRIKNPTAQRSQAAMQLADGVRDDWGDKGYVILMSGSPAPREPVDWWHQVEVAFPGFLKEGNIYKLKNRLAILDQRESIIGGTYPHLVSWRDDSSKCNKCGEPRDSKNHDLFGGDHTFEPSINEVSYLYERMKGLVLVKFKKDCLDLPEKRYEIIKIQPSLDTLKLAGLIVSKSTRAIQALTLLRELSDGFQYKKVEDGKKKCELCSGTGIIPDYANPGEHATCTNCKGQKTVPNYSRVVSQVPCKKDEVLENLLDQHDEIGRCVIYAGFAGSVDRVTEICLKNQWEVIQVDGRGWRWFGENEPENVLKAFQEDFQNHYRVAFVAQPGAGGMGLTLTASPSIIYFSNDFNGENRIQSEDRIHRPGMDINKGATIYDLIHLKSDEYVLDNLKKKKDLQKLSMGALKDVFA